MTLQYWKHWHKTWLFISIYLLIEPFIITFKCYDRNNYQWSYIAMKKHLIGIKIRIAIMAYILWKLYHIVFFAAEKIIFLSKAKHLYQKRYWCYFLCSCCDHSLIIGYFIKYMFLLLVCEWFLRYKRRQQFVTTKHTIHTYKSQLEHVSFDSFQN